MRFQYVKETGSGSSAKRMQKKAFLRYKQKISMFIFE